MKQTEERELIQNTRQGNLDAFNQLVLEYQTVVYDHTLWILRNQETAKDFTQNTFIQAYQNLNSFRDGSFRSWLMRIAANASLDELRRLKRRPLFYLTQAYLGGDRDG